eukprot:COSAG01_NODE_4741_length_4773_cov_31.477963_2_plen_102_part_00
MYKHKLYNTLLFFKYLRIGSPTVSTRLPSDITLTAASTWTDASSVMRFISSLSSSASAMAAGAVGDTPSSGFFGARDLTLAAGSKMEYHTEYQPPRAAVAT